MAHYPSYIKTDEDKKAYNHLAKLKYRAGTENRSRKKQRYTSLELAAVLNKKGTDKEIASKFNRSNTAISATRSNTRKKNPLLIISICEKNLGIKRDAFGNKV